MTGPDLLESGSARSPSRTARRRLVGIAAVLALVAGAIVLAARADPARPGARPAPAPAAPPVVIRPPRYYLYDTAVTAGRVYALAGRCIRGCGFRLLSWDGARWTSTPMTVPAGADSPGRLLLTGTGDKFLAVLDGTRPGAYVSADGGRTFGTRPARTGTPTDGVPAGLVPELGAGGIGVFDPVPATWRPLLRQPPLRDVRSITAAGRFLYAAARDGTALVVATSADAGRSWTRTTATRVPYRTPELQLVPSADGTAYLVVTRPLPAGEPGVASVWHGGPTWRLVVDFSEQGGGTPKYSSAVGTPNGGILLTDGSSGGELAYDTGRTVNFGLPPGAVGDPPLVPQLLRRGANRVAAITADGGHLLLRRDTDAGWTVVPLPA